MKPRISTTFTIECNEKGEHELRIQAKYGVLILPLEALRKLLKDWDDYNAQKEKE